LSIIINLILFIFILGLIVLIHELGHFTWAKITGVYVYEFSIGMGPKLWGRKGKETEYSIRLIPIGGYCQLAGEDLDDDDDNEVPKDRRLQSKNCLQRFLIMVFGPVNNFLLAIVLLFFIALIWGGSTMKPVLSAVEVNSAAYDAGLSKGDTILKINGHKISTSDDITLYLAVSDYTKKTTFVVEKENGEQVTYKVKAKKVEVDGEESYKYGIEIKQAKTHGIGSAFVYTYKKTVSIFKQMFVTVGYLCTGGIKLSDLSGPVGIYSIVGEQRSAGVASIIYLIAFLSINVGFMNLLPIPAFDGGHILFIIIEVIKGSPVKPELENKIHTVFLMLLMLLMVVITINDILRLF
jgi:regulator of sigma E protease